MKKNIFFLLSLLTVFSFSAAAQHSPGANDIARALRGGRVSIHSSKDLLEASESAVIDIKLTVAPVVNEQTLETDGQAYDIPLPDGSDPNIPAAYTASNWHVVQGGGSVSSIQGNTCVYTAPAHAPADKIMVISVDMTPTSNVLPKIVLLKTIYFVEDETAIVVNLPAGGFPNQKYVTSTGGGMKVPGMQGMDPRVASHIDAGLQAKMAQAQQAVAAAQANTGINLSAITSNSMAYFDGQNDLTVVKFNKLTMQMSNGKDVRKMVNGKPVTPVGSNLTYCVVSFKGHGVGNYPLDAKPSGVGLMDGPPKGCGCGNNRPDDGHCNGYINVTSVENGIMKGNFSALVYTSTGGPLIQGYIYGRFTANIVNTQQ